jgi:hypothetical protein
MPEASIQSQAPFVKPQISSQNININKPIFYKLRIKNSKLKIALSIFFPVPV